MPTDLDDLVIGSGMAALSLAALLAHHGRRVVVLEAHDEPGGYAHTFSAGDYRFSAEVHYLFGCGEGEIIHRFLDHLGLAERVTFERLDPEGFDHVCVGDERHRICNDFAKHRERLIHRFPEHAEPLRAWFGLLMATRDELDRMPSHVGWRDVLTAPVQFPHLLRERSATVADVFDRLRMPTRLRTILAGQWGDYLLPPRDASFLLHTALVSAYDRGAWYPTHHVHHLVDSLVDQLRARPGCDVLTGHEVEAIEVEGGRAVGARVKGGATFRAARVFSNADPAVTALLAGPERFGDDWLERLAYPLSTSSFTVYLGLQGVDLRAHGFGRHNTWYYPHDDLDGLYDRQQAGDLSDPWLFVSTPTLHTSAPGLAPPGHDTMVLATSAGWAPWRRLQDTDRDAYRALKARVTERILDVVEARWLPGLRDHVTLKLSGTPTTNELMVNARRGNAYGAALTPRQVTARLPFETPIGALYQVNATAGWPSVGGTIATGCRLFSELTGVRW